MPGKAESFGEKAFLHPVLNPGAGELPKWTQEVDIPKALIWGCFMHEKHSVRKP